MKLLISALAVMWLLSGVSARPGARADDRPSKKPNIVLIVADDLGFHDLGCLDKTVKTPYLDRVAREGIRASNFYEAWPACTPSRASLMTGRYPQRHGLYDMIRNDMVNYGHKYTPEEYALSPEMTLGLDVREVTIAQILQKAGYSTAMIGKWDLGQAKRFLPRQRSFDRFFGIGNNGIDYYTHERYGVHSLFRDNTRVRVEGYATNLFRDEAMKFIQDSKDNPFFLYLAFNAPHSASSFDKKNRFQVPEEYLKEYPDADPKANRTRFKAMVTCMDEAIGQLLDQLKKLNLENDTCLIFLSDNGGTRVSNNGPLRGYKAQMFEGGLRVPFLARWPGRIPAGRLTEAFLTSLEIFPTLASIGGARLPDGVHLDGFDMLPVLQGKAKSQRTEMFWQRRKDRACRVDHWKWVESASGAGLFNLASDVGESKDLSRRHPDVLAKLKGRWEKWRQDMDKSEPRGPFRDY